jgi:hypothetical protein
LQSCAVDAEDRHRCSAWRGVMLALSTAGGGLRSLSWPRNRGRRSAPSAVCVRCSPCCPCLDGRRTDTFSNSSNSSWRASCSPTHVSVCDIVRTCVHERHTSCICFRRSTLHSISGERSRRSLLPRTERRLPSPSDAGDDGKIGTCSACLRGEGSRSPLGRAECFSAETCVEPILAPPFNPCISCARRKWPLYDRAHEFWFVTLS